MSKELILVIIGFGVAVVGIGFYFFFFGGKEKNKGERQTKNISLEELIATAKNQKSTKEELQNACSLLVGEFEFNESTKEQFLMMVFLIAKHKNSDSKLILNLRKEIKTKSPELAKEVERYGKAGLDER